MGRTALRCTCGQRIGEREVLRAGYYPRPFGPSFVLVRYRCSRCRRRGEQFLRQEEWDQGILSDAALELDLPSQKSFATQGPITMREQATFHSQLDSLGLRELIAEFDHKLDE
jgi:hypothetical protein